MAGIYNGPARGGNRGGKDQFGWENVKEDKYHQSYIGHSVMAPLGRWQKGKDLFWFLKKTKVDLNNAGDHEKKEVRAKEHDLMLQLLGEKPMQPPPRADLDRIQKNKLLKKGDAEEGTVAEAITKEEFGERVEGIGYAPIKIDDLRQAMETSTSTRLEGTGINDLLAAHAAGEGTEQPADDDHAAMLAAIEGLHQQLASHSPSLGPMSRIDRKEQKRMKKELKKLQKAERKTAKKKKSEKKNKSKAEKPAKKKLEHPSSDKLAARCSSSSSSSEDEPPPYRLPPRASPPGGREPRRDPHFAADSGLRWRTDSAEGDRRRRSPSPGLRSSGGWGRDSGGPPRRRSRSPEGERRGAQARRSWSRSRRDRQTNRDGGGGGRSRSRDYGDGADSKSWSRGHGDDGGRDRSGRL